MYLYDFKDIWVNMDRYLMNCSESLYLCSLDFTKVFDSVTYWVYSDTFMGVQWGEVNIIYLHILKKS